MVYEKKLIILSGSGSAKGTVSIERSAYGTFVTLNVYNAPDLTNGEYFLGIREQDKTFTRNLGSMGRIATRYKLADIALSSLHCFLYDDSLTKIVLYGTNCPKRIWESNLLDGVRGIVNESKAIASQKTAEAIAADGMPQFSKRKEIGDYFFDIIPPEGGYVDSAIAEVNYYSSNLSYKQSAESVATAPAAHTQNINGEARPLPSELERRYLYRYHPQNRVDSFNGNAQKNTQPNTQPSNKQQPNTQQQNMQPNAQQQNKQQPNKQQNMQQSYMQQNMQQQNMQPPIHSAPPNPQIINAQAQPQKQANSISANDITIAPPNTFTVAKAVSEPCSKASFYQQTAQQIEQLFSTNPRNEKLEKLLPNTKFISVDFDKSGKFYVVGVIGTKPDYLCYGVPGKYSPTPPTELEGYCAFLPTLSSQPQGDGFWLMFQDAETGESVEKEKI